MKRRTFFKYTLPSVVMPALLGGFKINAFAGNPLLQNLLHADTNGRVLVVIQLAGGNDGLNTVIPIEFYGAYKNARPNIAIAQEKILPLNGCNATGLNPAMAPLQQLFNQDRLAIVQAVSYPQPSFSHFRATDIWLTGEESNQVLNTGWMGRYLNRQYPDFPDHYPNSIMPHPLAIQIGSVVSTGLQGPAFPMGMAISNPDSFYNMLNEKQGQLSASPAQDQLDYIRQVAEKTDAYGDVIKAAAKKITRQSTKYDDNKKNPLSDQLKIVSRLIAGGLQTKIYMVSMGGFDNHAKQTDAADTSKGTHANQLQRLSEAIAAFMDDLALQQVADRVVGMTFSEFGRRIKSNASGGTDHGIAAPVFVFGQPVRSGIIGSNPVIPENATVNDNITMQHDFRAVYATLLEDWLGVKPSNIPDILQKNFATLPLIKKG
ncbi:MAG: hypothetical protein JWR61_446 [Ferruginibacter sp.]|uniref:DUF1501 domain-containing protein n=1 Tax=Ferruginibacter sp. TaxID=1940288 RepID=UPI002657EE5D|nr:DUF1501 domain-containing protein [Ferruginibacter sp.]MDB5275491.1 hypothetical protein [Ferruginibacter sp.]